MDWCRICRKWVEEDHFKLPDGSLLGCGQGRCDIRYHPIQPRMGDIWSEGGTKFIVDYVNEKMIHISTYPGKAEIELPTIGAFAQLVMGRLVIFDLGGSPFRLAHVYEDHQFPGADEEGWANKGTEVSFKAARRYCKTVLEGLSNP